MIFMHMGANMSIQKFQVKSFVNPAVVLQPQRVMPVVFKNIHLGSSWPQAQKLTQWLVIAFGTALLILELLNVWKIPIGSVHHKLSNI